MSRTIYGPSGGGGPVDTTVIPRYVSNGDDPNTARPSGPGLVIWVGSVTPVNMADGDVRISTS